MSTRHPDYTIRFTNSAAREFRTFPPEIKRRVAAVIDSLQQKPRPAGVRKLRGSTELYRIRIGPYRLVYEIDDSMLRILVTKIRYRSDAYR